MLTAFGLTAGSADGGGCSFEAINAYKRTFQHCCRLVDKAAQPPWEQTSLGRKSAGSDGPVRERAVGEGRSLPTRWLVPKGYRYCVDCLSTLSLIAAERG